MKIAVGVAFRKKLAIFYETWQAVSGSLHEAMQQLLHRLDKRGRYSNRLKSQTLNSHISSPVSPRVMTLCTQGSPCCACSLAPVIAASSYIYYFSAMEVYGSPYNRVVDLYKTFHNHSGSCPEALHPTWHRLARGGRYSKRLKSPTLNRHISCPVGPRVIRFCTDMPLLTGNTFASRTHNFRLLRFPAIFDFVKNT